MSHHICLDTIYAIDTHSRAPAGNHYTAAPHRETRSLAARASNHSQQHLSHLYRPQPSRAGAESFIRCMDFFLDSLNNAGLGVHCVHFASTVVTPHFCNLLCRVRGGSAGAAWRGGGRGHDGSHPLAGDQGRGSCGRSRRRSGAEDWTPRARCCCPGQSPHRTAAAPHSAWRGSMAGPPINTEAEQPHCGGRRARPATGLRDHGTGQVGEESDGAAGHRRSCTTECVAFIGGRLDNC